MNLETRLDPGVKAIVTSENELPNNIRSKKEIARDNIVGQAYVGDVLQIMYCRPDSEGHYPTPTAEGYLWWYVRFEVGGEALYGWTTETGLNSRGKPVYYLKRVDGSTNCQGNGWDRLPMNQDIMVTPAGDGLFLRRAPGTGCPKKAVLPKGTRVRRLPERCVRSEDMNWWKVEAITGVAAPSFGWASQGRDKRKPYLMPAN